MNSFFPDSLIKFAAVSLAILFYYGVVSGKVVACSRYVTHNMRLTRHYSLSEVDQVVKLWLAGISQLGFCIFLLFINHLDFEQLGLSHFHPPLMGFGLLLGIGEMALGSLFGYIAIRTATLLAPAKVPDDLRGWLALMQAGWMRQLLKTAEIAPLPLALLSIVGYIAIEEIIFRSVLINIFLPAGNTWALGASMVLFAIVQAFNMPSWTNVIFPVIGASIMGLLHGALFIAVPDIFPLIIAHIVFFVTSIL